MLTTISISPLLSMKSKVFGLSGMKLSHHEPFKSFSRNLGNYISDNWMILLWGIILLITIIAIFSSFASLRKNFEDRKVKRSVMAFSTFFILWLSIGVYTYSYDVVKYTPWGTHKQTFGFHFKKTTNVSNDSNVSAELSPITKSMLLNHNKLHTHNTCPTDSSNIDNRFYTNK